jgi:hypothetical protein
MLYIKNVKVFSKPLDFVLVQGARVRVAQLILFINELATHEAQRRNMTKDSGFERTRLSVLHPINPEGYKYLSFSWLKS